jgi:hypothetical protein
MIMAVSVQIPTVKPAPKPVGMRTGKHTQSATPHTIFRHAELQPLRKYFIVKIKINQSNMKNSMTIFFIQ